MLTPYQFGVCNTVHSMCVFGKIWQKIGSITFPDELMQLNVGYNTDVRT